MLLFQPFQSIQNSKFFLFSNRGTRQYFSVFHGPSTLKSISLVYDNQNKNTQAIHISKSFHEWRFFPLKLYNSIIISFVIFTDFVCKLQPQLEKGKICARSVYVIPFFSQLDQQKFHCCFHDFFYKYLVTVFIIFETFAFSGNTIFVPSAVIPSRHTTSFQRL